VISRASLSFTAAIAAATLLALSASLSHTRAQEPAASAPSIRDLAPAIVPADRLDLPWWAERHARIVETVRRHPDVGLLLIGGSIIQNFERSNPPDQDFQPIWKQFYEPRHALNLGFSGDTTANLLWRLTHGEIDGLRPQAAVVLIGTNNTGYAHQTAEQTEAGIANVVGTLTQRLPQTRILLLCILPSGISPEKTAADQAVNAWLAKRYGNKTQLANASAHAIASRECHSERSAKRAVEESPNSACPATTPSPSTAASTPANSQQTDPRVTYLDISSIFMTSPGATSGTKSTLNAGIFYDPRLPTPGKPLHPDTKGQRKMAEAIEPTLAKLMYDKPRIATTAATTVGAK
jgi:lysophospholipase L1-like esterase